MERLGRLPDPRLFHSYSNASLAAQGLWMFLTGEVSRNTFGNSIRYSPQLNNNFGKLFKGGSLAHTDTVNNYLSSLTLENMEGVKTSMIKEMLAQKRISPGIDGYYTIVIDGVHIATYDDDVEGRL